jgi:hypothetical protein
MIFAGRGFTDSSNTATLGSVHFAKPAQARVPVLLERSLKPFFSRLLGIGGQKFVAVNSRSHAALTTVGLGSHHLRKAPDVDVTGKCNFAG